MPLYNKETDISPLYNGEENASVYKETEISPLYNGEVNASVYKETEISPLNNGEVNRLYYRSHRYLAVDHRRSEPSV